MFALALLVPFLASIWIIGVPGTLSPSTFAVLAAVLAGFSAVTLKTYLAGQADDSIGQILHATEVAATSTAVRTPDTRSKA